MKLSPNALLVAMFLVLVLIGMSIPYLKQEFLTAKLSKYGDVLHITPDNVTSSTTSYISTTSFKLSLHLNAQAADQLRSFAARSNHEQVAVVLNDDVIGEITLTPDFDFSTLSFTLPADRAGQIHYTIGH